MSSFLTVLLTGLGTGFIGLRASGDLYILYPPKSSSDPSPDNITFTSELASLHRKYKAMHDGSDNGSSA